MASGVGLAHGAVMRGNGLDMPADFTFEEWVDVLSDIARHDNARQWAWADALLAGQDKFGVRWMEAIEVVAKLQKRSVHTIENWISIARAWPKDTRPDGFPFSIAGELAALKRSEDEVERKAADEVAKLAFVPDQTGGQERMTVQEVRAAKRVAVQAIRAAKGGHDFDAGEAIDNAAPAPYEGKTTPEHVRRARLSRQVREDIAGLIQYVLKTGGSAQEATESVLAYLWIDAPPVFIQMVAESRSKGENR